MQPKHYQQEQNQNNSYRVLLSQPSMIAHGQIPHCAVTIS
jgi:hypothetical protein